jgi:hypothetical protein
VGDAAIEYTMVYNYIDGDITWQKIVRMQERQVDGKVVDVGEQMPNTVATGLDFKDSILTRYDRCTASTAHLPFCKCCTASCTRHTSRHRLWLVRRG